MGKRNRARRQGLFGYINKWKDYRYLLGMGFFLHLLMPLKELSLGWQKNVVSAVDQEQRQEKSLSNILMLKSICEKGKVLELPYVKTILDNIHDDCCQTFNFNNVERAETTISNNAVIWCDNEIDCVRNRFDEDTNKPIIDAANMILNSWSILQEESSNEEVSEDTMSENEDDGSHSETEIEVGSHDERGESVQEDEEPPIFSRKQILQLTCRYTMFKN